MERRFYCNESDRIVTESELRKLYEEDPGEHDTFSEYLSCCMVWNNGTLQEIPAGLRGTLYYDYRRGNVVEESILIEQVKAEAKNDEEFSDLFGTYTKLN